MTIGFVVGLQAEASLLRSLGSAVQVGIGGAVAAGTREAVSRLIRDGVRHLVSFGLAAGLDPDARAGDVLVPSRVVAGGRDYLPDLSLCARLGGMTSGGLLHSEVVVATAARKRALHVASLCTALDMESGIVARAAQEAGLPFAVLRAVCDPAGRDLPHAAMAALKPDGGLALPAILFSLLRGPGQIPGMLALARDAALARRALAARVRSIRA